MEKKEKLLLKDVKKKLKEVREKCPGMSEDFYSLVEYMSEKINDQITPMGMATSMVYLMRDLETGKDGFNNDKPLPDDVMERKDQMFSQIPFIPQAVDAIADKEFAKEFRKICSEVLEINTPERVDVDTTEEYPPYITAAVDWWALAIQSPSFANGDINPALAFELLKNNTKYTEDEIKRFKNSLAKAIQNELESSNNRSGKCYLDVDYHPWPGSPLDIAEKESGIGFIMWPIKTGMDVSKDEVLLYSGRDAKVIWSKEKVDSSGEGTKTK